MGLQTVLSLGPSTRMMFPGPPRAPGIHTAYRHACRQNTHVHKKKQLNVCLFLKEHEHLTLSWAWWSIPVIARMGHIVSSRPVQAKQSQLITESATELFNASTITKNDLRKVKKIHPNKDLQHIYLVSRGLEHENQGKCTHEGANRAAVQMLCGLSTHKAPANPQSSNNS